MFRTGRRIFYASPFVLGLVPESDALVAYFHLVETQGHRIWSAKTRR